MPSRRRTRRLSCSSASLRRPGTVRPAGFSLQGLGSRVPWGPGQLGEEVGAEDLLHDEEDWVRFRDHILRALRSVFRLTPYRLALTLFTARHIVEVCVDRHPDRINADDGHSYVFKPDSPEMEVVALLHSTDTEATPRSSSCS